MVFVELGGVFINVAHIITVYERNVGREPDKLHPRTYVTTTALDGDGSENLEITVDEPAGEVIEKIRKATGVSVADAINDGLDEVRLALGELQVAVGKTGEGLSETLSGNFGDLGSDLARLAEEIRVANVPK